MSNTNIQKRIDEINERIEAIYAHDGIELRSSYYANFDYCLDAVTFERIDNETLETIKEYTVTLLDTNDPEIEWTSDTDGGYGVWNRLNKEVRDLVVELYQLNQELEALEEQLEALEDDEVEECETLVQWVLDNDPSYIRYIGFNRVEGFDLQCTKKQKGKQIVLDFFYEIEYEDGEKVKIDFLVIAVNPHGVVYELTSKINISTREDNIKRHTRFANDLYRFCGNLVMEQEATFNFDYKTSGNEYPYVREFSFKVED